MVLIRVNKSFGLGETMRHARIELASKPWEGFILPLYQWRMILLKYLSLLILF